MLKIVFSRFNEDGSESKRVSKNYESYGIKLFSNLSSSYNLLTDIDERNLRKVSLHDLIAKDLYRLRGNTTCTCMTAQSIYLNISLNSYSGKQDRKIRKHVLANVTFGFHACSCFHGKCILDLAQVVFPGCHI